MKQHLLNAIIWAMVPVFIATLTWFIVCMLQTYSLGFWPNLIIWACLNIATCFIKAYWNEFNRYMEGDL